MQQKRVKGEGGRRPTASLQRFVTGWATEYEEAPMTGEPVTTGAQAGEGSGASGSPEPGAAVGTGAQEMVPKERFDGLMGSLNREKAEKEKLAAELATLRAQKEEATRQGLDDSVLKLIDEKIREAKAETSTVFNSLKSQATRTLLEKYPYATEDSIRGTSPDEWEAAARAEHERVKTIVDARAKEAADAAEKKAAEMFGSPLGVGPGGARPAPPSVADLDAQLKAARERGDQVEVTRLTLLRPLANQNAE